MVSPWFFPLRLRVRFQDAGSVATARVFGKHHWATNLTHISVSKVPSGPIGMPKRTEKENPKGKLWWIACLSSGGYYVYLFVYYYYYFKKKTHICIFSMILPELKLDEGKNRRKLPHKASLTNPASSGKWGSWTTWSDKTTWGLKSPGMAQCVFWQQRGVSATRTIGFQWISSTKIWRDCFFFWGGVWDPVQNVFFFLLAIIWFGTPGFHFCTFGTLPCRSARPMRAPQGSLEVKAQPILGWSHFISMSMMLYLI